MFTHIDEAQMKPEQISAMREAADSACALLKAIGNRDRLMLLCQMIDGEKSVGEFEELLDIRQPTLSQQLGVLRSEGVVETRRDGKRIYYRLASREAETLLNTLYGLFCPATLPVAKARAPGRAAGRGA
jgi:ArsR family transcriptional regulator